MSAADAKKELESYNHKKLYLDIIKKEAQKPRAEGMSEEEHHAHIDKNNVEIARLNGKLDSIKRCITEKIEMLEFPHNTILYFKYILSKSVEDISNEILYSVEYIRRLMRKAIDLYDKL